jgi:hypothetical protein
VEVVEEVDGSVGAAVEATGTALSGTGASSGEREAGFTVSWLSGIKMKSFIMPDVEAAVSDPNRG